MKVIKKVNNNIAICKDKYGQELVAFGRGLGFKKIPYELKDLSKIEMTFYKVSPQNISLLSIIPEEVLSVSLEIVKKAQKELDAKFSPNVIFSLADHINFAIQRLKKNQIFDFSLSYDINHLYPKEYLLGKESVCLINQRLNVKLPDEESTGIALHFINSKEGGIENEEKKSDTDLLNIAIGKIENYFDIEINLKSFIFNRFKVHFQYYLNRLIENKQIKDEISLKLINDNKTGNPKVYECCQDIIQAVDTQLKVKTTDDEEFYLMIYINRILKQMKEEK